jgi:Flp pilus assembly protein TadD/ribosomal 50S subunit-recycling heat shock protein
MIPASREEQKKEAFRLFEDGRHQESLQLCTILLESGRDSAVEVLAATNLYYTGKLEDAEVFFRDLAQKMPDSSYVHSYLAKVLEARKDEGAIAEFATAVHLDPTNQDALRSYAGYLISHRDYRGALPVLRRLVQLGKKPGDVQNLMRVLIEIGEPEEALTTHSVLGEDAAKTHEYVDALIKTGNFHAAAQSAYRMYRDTKDPALLRKYLDTLSRYDVPASLDAYSSYIQEDPDAEILFDYILLLKSKGDYGTALAVIATLLEHARDPVYRLLECDLLAALGQEEKALTAYETLIRDELVSKNDLDTLVLIISKYRQYLKAHVPEDNATRRFLDIVSKDVNVASLLETARFYEDRGNVIDARSWYYRAYRADFLAGGLDYAKFLSAHGEERECEKVMLYILSNVKKGADVGRVATVILDKQGKMYQLKRLMEQLIKKLEERRATLNSEGLELLAIAFFIAATNAQEEMDYAGCKYYCLCGIDVMPAHTRAIRLEDYLQLIRVCKERSIADRPIMNAPQTKKRSVAVPKSQVITDQLGLSEQEQKIVEFLRSHRKASEMDLRKLLGTRRVAGIVNQIIQKAASQGLSLISKKGVGEDGEVYEYTGT